MEVDIALGNWLSIQVYQVQDGFEESPKDIIYFASLVEAINILVY